MNFLTFNRKRLFIAVFIVVNVLIFGTQAVVFYFIQQNEKYARQINLAGRQRMLSQKIAKDVLSSNPLSAGKILLEVEQWDQVHQGLEAGDQTLQIEAISSPKITDQLEQAEMHIAAIKIALQASLSGQLEWTGLSEQVHLHEQAFLKKMDRIVFDLETASNLQHYRFKFVIGAIIIFSLFIMIFGFFLIFKPLHKEVASKERSIHKKMELLRMSNLDMEEKMGQLDQAYSDLQLVEEDLLLFNEEQAAMNEQLEAKIQLSKHYINQLDLTQETAGIGFWSYDLKEESVWSDYMYTIFGLPLKPEEEGIEFETWTSLIHPDDQGLTYQMINKSLLIGEIRHQFRIIRECGEIRKINMITKKQTNSSGEFICLFGVCQDITEDLNAREALVEAKEVAENAARVKQEFLANMSHEIRTPMNAILGFSDIVLHSSLNVEQKKYMQIIFESAQTLLVVINDILDFSKIEAGKLTIEKIHFRMDMLLAMQQKLFSVKVEESNIQLIFDTDPTLPAVLIGDRVRISQILNNLIGNAIKFTEKGEVRVTTSVVDQELNYYTLEIEVKDTGTGIAQNKLEAIFNSFEQENDSTNRQYGGTGLGLTIVKKIIEMMGGEIWVESQEKQGSAFTIRLQLAKGDENEVLSDTTFLDDSLLKQLTQQRILLAEDNRNNQMLAQKCLADVGCIVDIACNGDEALQMLEHHPYDAILMDIRMPVMDGIQATEAIKNLQSPQCNIPIIAMTAHALKEEENHYRQVGMNEYVSKPFNPQQLYTKLIKVLNGKSWDDPDITALNLDLSELNKVVYPHPSGVESDASYASDGLSMPSYDKIEYANLLDFSSGDEEFFHSMLMVFIEDAPEYLRQLEVAFQEKNWEEFKGVAHTLKSASSFLGMLNMMHVIISIENMAVEELSLETIEQYYVYIRQNCENAIKEVKSNLED